MSAFEFKIIGYFIVASAIAGVLLFLFVMIIIDILRAYFCNIREKWVDLCINIVCSEYTNIQKDLFKISEWLYTSVVISNYSTEILAINIVNGGKYNASNRRKIS